MNLRIGLGIIRMSNGERGKAVEFSAESPKFAYSLQMDSMGNSVFSKNCARVQENDTYGAKVKRQLEYAIVECAAMIKKIFDSEVDSEEYKNNYWKLREYEEIFNQKGGIL